MQNIGSGKKWIGWMIGATVAVMLLAGCASYYQVTDPATGKVYYTKDVDEKSGGAVMFEDANSGSRITLQNSEIKEINKEMYKANTAKEE